MSFIQFEYEPSEDIMNELRDQLSIIGSVIISGSKILDVCGVGKMVLEERVDTYQSIIDSMDNLLLDHCKEFARWMIENKLVDCPHRIYKPNESSFKVIKREDGTEWLKGVNTSDQPIQVTVSRSVEKAYNMETGKSTTIPTGPWEVTKIHHERNTNKYMEIPCPTDKRVFDKNDKSTWNCPLSDTDRQMLEQSVKNTIKSPYIHTCLAHESFLFRKDPINYKPYKPYD